MAQVKQLRLVVHAEDYEQALVFFRDVLGMPTAEAYAGDDGAEVTILDAGRATLELANTAQVEMIDDVEVGRRVAPHLRLALEVDDCDDGDPSGARWRGDERRTAHPNAVELAQLPDGRPRRHPPDALPGARRRHRRDQLTPTPSAEVGTSGDLEWTVDPGWTGSRRLRLRATKEQP